jgi:hypothetical protein
MGEQIVEDLVDGISTAEVERGKRGRSVEVKFSATLLVSYGLKSSRYLLELLRRLRGVIRVLVRMPLAGERPVGLEYVLLGGGSRNP